jgi:EAL domain-containing protein (putative c-di-GMP-specific phosphodiesterase class I)
MYQDAKRFIDRKAGMQKAILDGAFEVYYQPIVDIRSEKLTSMEALIRWPHHIEGMVSPAEFIPIAEETGLIMPLGEWVLRTVCTQIRAWNEMGHDDFRVAVNLSSRQFENDISKLVEDIILESGISPCSLSLEITEGIAMKNVDANVQMLESYAVLASIYRSTTLVPAIYRFLI